MFRRIQNARNTFGDRRTQAHTQCVSVSGSGRPMQSFDESCMRGKMDASHRCKRMVDWKTTAKTNASRQRENSQDRMNRERESSREVKWNMY